MYNKEKITQIKSLSEEINSYHADKEFLILLLENKDTKIAPSVLNLNFPSIDQLLDSVKSKIEDTELKRKSIIEEVKKEWIESKKHKPLKSFKIESFNLNRKEQVFVNDILRLVVFSLTTFTCKFDFSSYKHTHVSRTGGLLSRPSGGPQIEKEDFGGWVPISSDSGYRHGRSAAIFYNPAIDKYLLLR